MHVKRIKSNIKGGLEHELGEKTLIVGPNGRGKSAVVNAVELALGGSASDIVGRAEVKRESDLLPLADGKRVSSTAEFTDGKTASYLTESNGRGGAKKAKHDCPVSASFPVREVRAALGGSSDTARSWLLSKVVQDVTRDDVLAWFTPEAKDLYNHYANHHSGSEIDILLGVMREANKQVRADKKRVTTEQSVLERLGANLNPEPTETDLDDAAIAADEALIGYEAAMKANAKAEMAERVSTLKEYSIRLIEEMSSAEADLDEVQNLASPGPEPTEKEVDLIDRVHALAGIHRMHVDLGVDSCLVCERPGVVDHSSLKSGKLSITKDINARKDWHDAMGGVAQRAIEAREAAQASVLEYQEAYAQLEAMDDPAVSLSEAKMKWDKAQIRKTAMEATHNQWKNLRSQKDAIRTLRTNISDLEDVAESAKQAVNRLVKTAVAKFEEAVQGYLPDTDTFKLVLEEDGKEVCRFGFDRGNRLHTALSGAEWARLTLALACASATGDEDLLIFTPEERAFDPSTLRDVMAALSDAPGQVLITSPIKHKGRLPKGWTVVEVDTEVVLDSTQTGSSPSLNL